MSSFRLAALLSLSASCIALTAQAQTAFPTEHHAWQAGRDDTARSALHDEIRRVKHTPPAEVVAHPAAADFPGSVPDTAQPVERTLTVDTRIPGWHSTGLYAAPGAHITVSTPAGADTKGLGIRIGCHQDALWSCDSWKRVPEISRPFPLYPGDTPAANAFGGAVYVTVADQVAPTNLALRITGCIAAPYFKLGSTSLQDWVGTIRSAPAPWAELEGRYLTISLPSADVRQLDAPDKVLEFWDRVQQANAALAALPEPRRDRFVLDRQIAAGYMHSGYPIMAHLDQHNEVANLAALQKGNWGFFHELGHNYQSRDWTFSGTGEVTCNLFSMHTFNTVLSLPMESHGSLRAALRHTDRHFADGSFENWKREPFLALAMYWQLANAFGWGSFEKVFAEYRAASPDARPRSDDERRDQWLVRYSKTVGRNLAPFFDQWKVPVSESAKAQIKDLPAWSPAKSNQGGDTPART